MKKTFYVTTPIYYTNAPIHLGGAYTTIAADVLARWHRLRGEEVFFLTGTDEHGQKIQEIAEKNGKKPKEFVDEIVKEFKEAFKMLNISNDNFIRTTDKEHEKGVKAVLQELYDKKFIYRGSYESCYCVGCEQYLTDSDLVDGKCPLHNREPERRKEESYLFKLSSFQKKLLKLIKTGEYQILPEYRRKEIITFLESGLKDISISRLKEKVSWGIELPFDKNHTCFVWVDAFWNYVSGLKGKKAFDKFWPADVQLMAKDIFRVHATIWPALLLALDYKLPKTLFIHGYFTVNGTKMSKSLGNVISPIYLAEKYGADSVRYFLMRNIPFGSDGDFSENALIERNNNELANKLGNLVSRVSTLVEKYGTEKIENKLFLSTKWKRIIKEGRAEIEIILEDDILDKKINLIRGSRAHVLKVKDKRKGDPLDLIISEHTELFCEVTKLFIERLIDNYEFDKALNKIFELIDHCNWYIQIKKPWKNHDKKVLYKLMESIRIISILLYPFIPETSEKINKQLGIKLGLLKDCKFGLIKSYSVKKEGVLFKKV